MASEREQTDPVEPGRPWGRYPLAGREPLTVTVGPRVLWLSLRDGELWVAHSPLEGRLPSRTETPPVPDQDSESWERWATESPIEEVELRPLLPPRPIVLEPERSFRLTRGAGARVYVRVPLWIQLRIPEPDPLVIEEVPTMTLSDTWWGGSHRGELAYWLPTTARREIRPELFQPHLGVCPLQMWNRSRSELLVDKLLLGVEHLSLFQEGAGRLWTDVSTVRYQGEGVESVIDRSGAAPDEAPEAQLVTPARSPDQTGLRAWTFQRLRGFPGFGGAS